MVEGVCGGLERIGRAKILGAWGGFAAPYVAKAMWGQAASGWGAGSVFRTLLLLTYRIGGALLWRRFDWVMKGGGWSEFFRLKNLARKWDFLREAF
jgi:hypothetical protein